MFRLVGIVETGQHDEHHLLVRHDNIFPNEENDDLKLTGKRNSVLRILFALFLCLSFFYDVPVDDTGVTGFLELDEEATVSELFICKTGDSGNGACFLVSPSNDVPFVLVSE